MKKSNLGLNKYYLVNWFRIKCFIEKSTGKATLEYCNENVEKIDEKLAPFLFFNIFVTV